MPLLRRCWVGSCYSKNCILCNGRLGSFLAEVSSIVERGCVFVDIRQGLPMSRSTNDSRSAACFAISFTASLGSLALNFFPARLSEARSGCPRMSRLTCFLCTFASFCVKGQLVTIQMQHLVLSNEISQYFKKCNPVFKDDCNMSWSRLTRFLLSYSDGFIYFLQVTDASWAFVTGGLPSESTRKVPLLLGAEAYLVKCRKRFASCDKICSVGLEHWTIPMPLTLPALRASHKARVRGCNVSYEAWGFLCFRQFGK